MKKQRCLPCLIGAIALLLGTITLVMWLFSLPTPKPHKLAPRFDEVIRHGQSVLNDYRESGADLSIGPCLDNGEAFPDWVIDVAHEPRQIVDNDPANQCSAYREGRASKFIELDTDGNFLREGP